MYSAGAVTYFSETSALIRMVEILQSCSRICVTCLLGEEAGPVEAEAEAEAGEWAGEWGAEAKGEREAADGEDAEAGVSGESRAGPPRPRPKKLKLTHSTEAVMVRAAVRNGMGKLESAKT